MYEKVIRSGTLLEYWSYEHAPINFRQKNPIRARVGPRKHATRRFDSVQRATKLFRRLVRANLVGAEHPALLTLTMHQIVSLKASSRFLTGFFVRLRKRYGSQLRFIVVPEFQKRGAVHFHILIWGLPKESICHGYWKKTRGKNRFYCTSWETGKCECSTREIQRLWCLGFADCIATDGSVKLAGYLAKYMSKAMSDVRLGGEKAYHASRNVLRSSSAATYALSDEVKEMVGLSDSPTHVHKFKTRWLGECTYQAFTIEQDSNKVQGI